MKQHNKAPRVLSLDIETAPVSAFVWRLFKENIGLEQIQHDWFILSFCAKWLGDDRVIYFDQRHRKNKENDLWLLKKLWKLLDEADWVVAQNGKRFDLPKIKARMLLNGMLPFSPVRVVDTMLIAKKEFSFTSNRLAYLSEVLSPEIVKRKHEKFPGFLLWKECLAGNMEAWEEMELYNIDDVRSMEVVYLKMRAWDTMAPNVATYDMSDESFRCPTCGSHNVHRRGTYRTGVGVYARYRCMEKNCGKWTRGAALLNSKEHRQGLLRNTV